MSRLSAVCVRRSLLVALMLAVAASAACSDSTPRSSGVDVPPDGEPEGFVDPDPMPGMTPNPDPDPLPDPEPGPRPATACRIPSAPDLSPLRVVEAFPALSFSQPIYMTSARDGTDRIFVVEKRGIIHVFDNDPGVTESRVFLDLRDRVFSRGGNDERGLLGLAFEPDFASSGRFWVNYTHQGNGTPTTISRFSVQGGDPSVADPDSEVVAMSIAQPFGNHNGGMIEFGHDGMLYISMGDGGSAGDPQNHGQRSETLLGTMLRIDVSSMGPDGEYSIPADNPFVGNGDFLPEIWAWGLRNVWRFSFDRLTGQLWGADVGQRRIEEVDIIESGGNYGWRRKEGSECYNPDTGCDGLGYIEPVAEYTHDVGLSITGGYVYRGGQLPELSGSYVYGDFANGQIFALVPSDEGAEPPLGHKVSEGFEVAEIAQTNLKIASFGEDEAGELFVVDYARGKLFGLERAGDVTPGEPLPLTLTETGCFSDVASQTPDRGLVPYEVNAQLWSDGASKERYFALPEGGKITFRPEGGWDFPLGAVIVKNFYLEAVEGDSDTRQIVETRFMVREETGYSGYSYQWNEDRTEAFLLPGSATRTYKVEREGQLQDVVWRYPSRGQCKACHTEASGQVLGLSTGQINRDVELGDGQRGQMDLMVLREVFDNPPASTDGLARFANPEDMAAPLADRARAYMHANCAHCHLPGGTATSDIDLRYETPLSGTNACDADPKDGDLGIEGLRLIDPGSAANSSMTRRMRLRNDQGMPPLASGVVDEFGTGLIESWIDELTGCTP